MKKILLSLLASLVIGISANANDIEKKEVKSPTKKEVKNSSKKEKTKEIKTEKTDEVVKGFGKILSYKEINKDYVRTIEYKLEIEYNSKNKDNSTKEIYTYITSDKFNDDTNFFIIRNLSKGTIKIETSKEILSFNNSKYLEN